MRILHKSVALIISLIFSFSFFGILAVGLTPEPTITVSKATGVPSDQVVINISIEDNPGIMAFTFTLSYDKDSFSYSRFYTGVFNDYFVADHPEKGYISFVNSEPKVDNTNNGNILSVQFNIKEKAAPGFHEMKIQNIYPEKNGDSLRGCFANYNHTTISPVAVSGGVTVGKTCTNSGHDFGEWDITLAPTCAENGIKTHSCLRCGHTEMEEIPKKEHDFENFWTIDQQASEGIAGVMSRHCKNCNEVTDKVTFSVPDTEKNHFTNQTDQIVTSNEWEKLKEIEEKNKKQISEKTDPVPDPNDKTPSGVPPKEEIKTSDEISDSKNIGIAEKISEYLFGSEKNDGIINIIKTSASKMFLRITSKWKYIIIILLILIL